MHSGVICVSSHQFVDTFVPYMYLLKYLTECNNYTACLLSLNTSSVVCHVQQAVQMEQFRLLQIIPLPGHGIFFSEL